MPTIRLSNNRIPGNAKEGTIIGTLSFVDDRNKAIDCTFAMGAHDFLTLNPPNYVVVCGPIKAGNTAINIVASPTPTSSPLGLTVVGNVPTIINISAAVRGSGTFIATAYLPQGGTTSVVFKGLGNLMAVASLLQGASAGEIGGPMGGHHIGGPAYIHRRVFRSTQLGR